MCIPSETYLWRGFFCEDVCPSPKSQSHATICPSMSEEASVKWTSSLVDGFEGEWVKDASGGRLTVSSIVGEDAEVVYFVSEDLTNKAKVPA